MQLSPHIYLVGSSGQWGFGISSKYDCSVFLVDTGAGCILIDSGSGIEHERIFNNISSHGFKLTDIKILLLTHYHADHAAGGARIVDVSGCKAYMGAAEQPFMAAGDEAAAGVTRGGLYPMDLEYRAIPSILPLKDGESVELGSVKLTGYAAPGHSLEDTVYYGEIDGMKCLFSGDAIFAAGEVILQSSHDCTIAPYRKSVKRLAEMEIDALLCGHSCITLSMGGEHVKRCSDYFERGVVPNQLLYFR